MTLYHFTSSWSKNKISNTIYEDLLQLARWLTLKFTSLLLLGWINSGVVCDRMIIDQVNDYRSSYPERIYTSTSSGSVQFTVEIGLTHGICSR